MRRTVVVMAAGPDRRTEIEGACPPLDEQAAIACERLVDTLCKASAVPDAELVISCDSADSIAFFREVTPPGAPIVVHEGLNHGERLARCFRHLCDPSNAVVAVRSDIPTLPARSLELAFDALASDEVTIALGPTAGGGFYLAGLRAPALDLVAHLDWDALDAPDRIAALAAEIGTGWYLLPEAT